MISILGISIRYLEIGVVAAGILLVGLIFLRRRPAGLVWVSVAAMGVLLVHLFLEEGRWQMAPLYAVVFAFAIWLAVPSRRFYKTGGLILRIVIVVLIVIPSLLLPVMVPIFVVPAPSGPFGVGVATVNPGSASPSFTVTIRYPLAPADADHRRDSILAPYWSLDEVNSHRLPGLPKLASTHLTLVPTNSILRGARADGSFPVVVAVPSPSSLPSDFIILAEQLASLGWMVVQTPPGADADDVVGLLGQLRAGEFDRAFSDGFDVDRAVLLGLGWDPEIDIGLPEIQVGGEELLWVVNAGGSYGIAIPDSRVPSDAITNRYLIVRPARVLVGGSDVPPGDLGELTKRAVSALLGDGSLDSAVFTAEPARTALAETRRAFADLLPDLTIRPLPDAR